MFHAPLAPAPGGELAPVRLALCWEN